MAPVKLPLATQVLVAADPDTGIGMAYAMNLMAQNLMGDLRGKRLIDTTFGCL
jgi:hypothetical protein